MSAYRPVRRLNNYYKSNDGFKAWIKANEQWFKENPEVFKQVLRNPNMVNLFMDLMVMNSPRIQKKAAKIWTEKPVMRGGMRGKKHAAFLLLRLFGMCHGRTHHKFETSSVGIKHMLARSRGWIPAWHRSY